MQRLARFPNPFFTCTQRAETRISSDTMRSLLFGGAGNNVCEELKQDTSLFLTADADFEETALC
jgi:hypothetical protein